MQAFEYARPSNKQDAVKLARAKDGVAAILAGGTDLLSLMKDDVVVPKRIIDIKSIKELQGISRQDGNLRLGALVTLEELLDHSSIQEEYPSLWQAAQGVHSPQIRSRGTVGGDLCQRPRCWYYRNGFGLLATQNGGSMVEQGDNRYHAILGNTGPAYFVNPSSLAPALIALGAKVMVFGPNGLRDIGLESFYRIPQQEGEKEYALLDGEIITEVRVPSVSGRKSAFYEVRHREVLDWPLASAAAVVELDGERIKGARVVLGHVAPIPWPAPEAEKFLTGQRLTQKVAERAGQAATRGAQALSRNGYKIQLAQVAVKRAILQAAGREV